MQCFINGWHVLTLALSPRLSRNQLELIGFCSCIRRSCPLSSGAERTVGGSCCPWYYPVLAKMAIDNHSKNSSHPSSITYLPLAYHYSSNLHPLQLLPSSSLFSSSRSHPFSDTTCQWDVLCGKMSVSMCVCKAHRVSIPPLRDQSRCQMPGAHKKEHHAFQLTFSSSVPTHIRLTHLLPTTPAHYTTVTGFLSHTSRGMSASQGCFMLFIMLFDRGLEFMNTAFLCLRRYRINQSDLRTSDDLSFVTEFSRLELKNRNPRFSPTRY